MFNTLFGEALLIDENLIIIVMFYILNSIYFTVKRVGQQKIYMD